MSKRKIILRLFLIIGGLFITAVSLFAYQLGLDNDPGWGARRLQILLCGLGMLLFAGWPWLAPFVFKADASFLTRPARPWARPSALAANVGLAVFVFLTAYLYIWITTFGTMNQWTTGKNYFGRLVQAFQHGQTYLLDQPNPELLKLENPYDHHQRKGIEYLWDTSLYNGRYYLYWGPVPAVMGWAYASLTHGRVLDSILVLIHTIGVAFFSMLLLRRLYLDGQIPAWAWWGGAAVSAFNVPLIWLLTRPTYYEVSISGGQLFMLAGFYFLYLAFRSPSKFNFSIASLMFALAGGARINLLPSVVFIAALMLIYLYISRPPVWISSFAAIVLPLIVVGLGLAWYNDVRFDSPVEFGHRYQLTGPSLTANYGDITSISYLIPNVYQYMFRTPEFSAEFPYIRSPWIKEEMWPAFIRLPEHYYYTEPVSGFLVIIPLVSLCLVFLAWFIWRWLEGEAFVKILPTQWAATSWLSVALLSSFVIQMSVLLVFINSAMRYLVDVSPALLLLCTLAAAWFVKDHLPKMYQVRLALAAWTLAILATVCFGLLIGFTGDRNWFLNNNPRLFYQLAQWLSF